MRETAQELGVDVFTVKTANPSCSDEVVMDEQIVPQNPKYRRFEYKEGTYDRIRIDTDCEKVWTSSSILSNGDVVPCCYHYTNELKTGNIHENPFTEIWTSAEYQALRKKVYTDKDSNPKCKACVINYKHSPAGMFVESQTINKGFKQNFENQIRRVKLFSDTLFPSKLPK